MGRWFIPESIVSVNKKKKCPKKDLVLGELYALRSVSTHKIHLDECPVVMYIGPTENKIFAQVLYSGKIFKLTWDSFYYTKESDEDEKEETADIPYLTLRFHSKSFL